MKQQKKNKLKNNKNKEKTTLGKREVGVKYAKQKTMYTGVSHIVDVQSDLGLKGNG